MNVDIFTQQPITAVQIEFRLEFAVQREVLNCFVQAWLMYPDNILSTCCSTISLIGQHIDAERPFAIENCNIFLKLRI